MHYRHLDDALRQTMLAEIAADAAAQRLYRSPRLNLDGEEAWESLLRAAVERHDAHWLTDNLKAYRYLRKTEKRQMLTVRVPFEAPRALAEGQFNRFYVRAVCLRAQAAGRDAVVIVAGRDLVEAPQAARDLVGSQLEAEELRCKLEAEYRVDRALGVRTLEPSGLTVGLIEG